MSGERNDKLISSKIDNEIKRFDQLDKSFSKLLEGEKQLKEKRVGAFEAMAKIDDENSYLSQMYNIFKQSMIDLEKSRGIKIDKLNNTIIPAVKYYPFKVKEFKKPINKIHDMEKNIEKHNEKIEKAKTKGTIDIDTLKKQEEEKNKMGHDKIIAAKTLESNIVQFEAERVDDNKAVLLQFIHMELAYHANAMQSLSKLYQEINVLEPKEKLKDFIAKYSLNSMRDYNLEDKFKFKEGETEKRIFDLKNKSQRTNKGDEGKQGPKQIVDPTKKQDQQKKVSVREKILDDLD